MQFSNPLEKLNKKGISTTVIGIILLVVGLAIVVLFVLFGGSAMKDKLLGIIFRLNVLKHSGGG